VEREVAGLPGAEAHLALTASMMRYYACWSLGDFETVRQIGRKVQEGEARGNRTVRKKGRIAMIRLALVADDVKEARLQLQRSNDVTAWERPGLFEAEQLEVAMLIELYAGNPELALELCRTGEPEHKGNMFWGHVVPGYAQSLVECAARDATRACSLQRAAKRLVRWVNRRSTAMMHQPVATATQAAIAFQRGNQDRALALLGEAEERFASREMAAYRDMARRQRGLLLGGEEGQKLIDEADAALSARGVVNPARFTHAHLTGFRIMNPSPPVP
jgi:hypothetical protein